MVQFTVFGFNSGFVLFSWDEYLAKTNSEAAPWGYFRQVSTIYMYIWNFFLKLRLSLVCFMATHHH